MFLQRQAPDPDEFRREVSWKKSFKNFLDFRIMEVIVDCTYYDIQ